MDSGRGGTAMASALAPQPRAGHCPHLAAILDGVVLSTEGPRKVWSSSLTSARLLHNFKFLQEYLQLLRLGIVDTAKIPAPACKSCTIPDLGTRRLHLCLHCASCFCFTKNHLSSHFADSGDHFLAVDTSNDHVYCGLCAKYVIHLTLREMSVQARHFSLIQMYNMTRTNDNKLEYSGWQPSEEEKAFLKKVPSEPTPLLGLRGLNNLGNTCFMNVVLQAFVANPLMSNYFLADAHNRQFCPLSRSSRHCLGCEADLLMENMFNGDRIPFSPHQFLLSTWRCTDHLAGYEQQDAHDFYISTMNAIHTHIGESLIIAQEERQQKAGQGKSNARPSAPSPPPPKPSSSSQAQDLDESLYKEDSFSDENCFCVTHKVFAGFLRSDVRCDVCRSVSTMKEAFLDISIELESVDGKQNRGREAPTLESGLAGFTKSEPLESFSCDVCRKKTTCTKQLSIEELPLTLCIHLKRFKHTLTSTRKIDTYMEFPLELDMTPYTCSGMSTYSTPTTADSKKAEGGSSIQLPPNGSSHGVSSSYPSRSTLEQGMPMQVATNGSSELTENEFVFETDRAMYSLYAVVIHSGNMENGHYTCFVRYGDEWYKCDDHTITKATTKQVLLSRAYLLFYSRSVLEYQKH